MEQCHILALSNAADGRDDDYRAWYQQAHLRDVCAIDGVVNGKFHEATNDNARWRYMALYAIAAGALDAVLATMAEIRGTERMRLTDSLDTTVRRQHQWHRFEVVN